MIGKVLRGTDVGGLLRYLYGPGRANEHLDPHLVASWDGQPHRLEPATPLPDARHDVRQLTGLLNQPLAATVRAPRQPVWHCAVRVAPTDRRLSDAEWRDVARDIMARTGLAPEGDDDACRWVAVRHADDHIHIVATLARQDGAAVRFSNDYYRVGEACRAAEERLGLTRTSPRDRTAARRATRGENEKARRAGRREPARLTLAREVRTAVAGAASPDEFFIRLTDAGLLVRQRYGVDEPGGITGYSVALPGDRAGRNPVWFGGAKLAADLSWPKLAQRWREAGELPPVTFARLTGDERAAVWRDAVRVTAGAAEEVRRLSVADPDAAADAAHATGRVLSGVTRAFEGRQGGPIADAADAFDRAARDLHGRVPARTPIGESLRATARLLALTGRAARDETSQVLAVLAALTSLCEAAAQLRDAQRRGAQATAARAAAEHLRRVTTPPPTRTAAAVVHRSRTVAAVHRSASTSETPGTTKRRVQP